MATGDLIYSNNHRVFALGQDAPTGNTMWWADFRDINTPNGGAHFFLRDEGPGYGNGPAAAVNPFALNHTYTLAIYEGDIAAVTGAVYQRTFNVNGVSMTYASGGSTANGTTLNLVDSATPGGLNADDPSQSVNAVVLNTAIPLPAASQYTVVGILVS